MHLSKLECQDKNSEGLYCKHGCFKAVNPGCHIELDNSEMFMPQIEFPTPTNFVCRKCVEASDIPSEIFLRKSSSETTLNEAEVIDVILRENPPDSEDSSETYRPRAAATGV